jgi:CDGSH-type Zn-finger protein
MDKGQIVKTSPFVLELTPGTYYWCACGKSSKQPYCDGTHKDTHFKPIREIISENKRVVWCGCKQTNTGPLCDGSHKKF